MTSTATAKLQYLDPTTLTSNRNIRTHLDLVIDLPTLLAAHPDPGEGTLRGGGPGGPVPIPALAPEESSRIVGEVMGKYHPHGDSAIYDTLVRLAQLGAALGVHLWVAGQRFGPTPGLLRARPEKLHRAARPLLGGDAGAFLIRQREDRLIFDRATHEAIALCKFGDARSGEHGVLRSWKSPNQFGQL